MAEAGQTVQVRQNGESFTFLATADDTSGELLRMEFALEPGGAVPTLHVHPRQEERLAIRGGAIGWHIDGREGVAQPGELIVIPRGAVHRVWNAGEDRSKAIMEFEPALRIEDFFVAYGELAAAGKLKPDGGPRLLDVAVILGRCPGVIAAPAPSPFVQRLGQPVLGMVGRALGYGP
jgi:mannose-6-phosphate isomerase-like protein (cupin superfamily)